MKSEKEIKEKLEGYKKSLKIHSDLMNEWNLEQDISAISETRYKKGLMNALKWVLK